MALREWAIVNRKYLALRGLAKKCGRFKYWIGEALKCLDWLRTVVDLNLSNEWWYESNHFRKSGIE